jgi:hypothetical protein
VLVNADGAIEGLSVGETSTSEIGAFTETTEIVSVTVANNGFLAELTITDTFQCENTCQFARDGICDEFEYCAVGTDCTDCGRLIAEGTGRVTIRTSGANGIEYVSSLRVSDDDGLVFHSVDCAGTLTR